MRVGLRACAVLLLAVNVPAARPLGTLKQATRVDYLAELGRLQGMVAACQARAEACDAAAVIPDLQVAAVGKHHGFTARWDWLRATLNAGKDPKGEGRAEMLAQAQARLVVERAEIEEAGADGELSEARAKADAVLRGREFSRVTQQNYLEQKLALLRLWIDRLLLGAAVLMPHSPWVSVVLEWGAVGLAAAGLMVWALRVSRQQRVAIASKGGAPAGWEKESEDWAERARVAASGGDWREAVHCLYWAAIVMLEGQRLWRANRARTPREYVRLLEPGSARRNALGSLTGVFERIWYGLRPAAEHDYRQAEALLADLKAGPH